MASGLSLEWIGRVAVVTLDDPESPVNTLGTRGVRDFQELLERLESAADLAGVVLASAKPTTFLAGADLDELGGLGDAVEAAAWVGRGQEILERFAGLQGSTVAAIQGAALGGGLEVALACDWRVAADLPATRLGLPEVRLGLIPALGGTYRLPRQVGLERGVEMLLTGRSLTARQAAEAGLVDAVVRPEDLRERALTLARKTPRTRSIPLRDRMLAGHPLGRKLFFAAARRRVAARTGGHYPAPARILGAVEVGWAGGRAAALAAERAAFGELAVSPVSRRLVELFLATRRLAARGDGESWRDRTLGVVGAGFMGSGVAAAAARAGLRVVLVDESAEALIAAMDFCRRRFASLARRGALSEAEARNGLGRIETSRNLDALAAPELVVEAVFEDLEVKRRLFAALERELAAGAHLGSNTSTLPIATLADGLARPERLVGIHFFSPVHRMPLVEVVRHAGTSEETVKRALDLAVALKKTPIVVNDGPGFYTTRILTPYLAQGVGLLLEGRAIARVDALAREVGFPVGPLELLDEVGIDVATHAARTLTEAFPGRMPVPTVFERLVREGRLGRKCGRGFYDYRGRKKRPDPEVSVLLGDARLRKTISDADPSARLLLAMAAEAVRCLEDGILEHPRDGDVGAVLGLGFPPFLGGPFRYLEELGADAAVSRLERLAAEFGPVFEPPQLLRQRAHRGDGFYD